MKKFMGIFFAIIVVITITTIVGYNLLMSGEEVLYMEDAISLQNEYEEYFSCYGYTLDNPNVVVNPYNISPLTALVMFESNGISDVEVIIFDKNNNVDFSYEVDGNKNNYIPIYGLYSDYSNKVIIKVGNKSSEINIKIGAIDKFDIIDDYGSRDFTFVNMDRYSYAVDREGYIRWYISGYGGDLNRLSNGNFVMHTDRFIGDGYYTGFVEMDMLGKIYYEYSIPNDGYSGHYVLVGNNYYVVSNGLIDVVNRQSGEIINYYEVDSYYDYIDYRDGYIICSNGYSTIEISIGIGEIRELDERFSYNNVYDMGLVGKISYNRDKGIRLVNQFKTETVRKKIWLFNYKNIDVQSMDIDIYEEFDRLVVKGKFSSDDLIYVILDGLDGKKIYEMYNDESGYYRYISNVGLSGRYAIYFKVNNTLYKSDYYVKF